MEAGEHPLDFTNPQIQKLALYRCCICENPFLHSEPVFSIRGSYVHGFEPDEFAFVCSSCNLIYLGWFQPMVYLGDFDARDRDALIRQFLFMRDAGDL